MNAELLDKESFSRTVTVPALRLPKQHCHRMQKKLQGFTIDQPRQPSIVPDGARQDTRLLLLRESTTLDGEDNALKALLDGETWELVEHCVTFTYTQLSAEHVLRRILPANVEVPGSFECVGHIARFNLKEEHLPYKHIIGQVVLDKIPHIKTVVNKVDIIENEFRVFPMEVLAGDPCMEATLLQHGARFKLDFSKVYWNSRLETEHQRLVEMFGPQDVVIDAMAGVGPFAIPAAMRGCTVYANDLNPASVHYLRINAAANRVSGRVHAFCLDARYFIRWLLAAPDTLAAPPPPSDSLAAPPAPASNTLAPPCTPCLSPPDAATRSTNATAAAAPTATSTAPSSSPAVAASSLGGEANGSGSSAAAAAAAGPVGGVQSSVAAAGVEGSGGVVPPHGGVVPPHGGVVFQHLVMNLPASAVTFLDALRGAFPRDTWREEQALPLVHVYTFMKGKETQADVLAKVEQYLGGILDAPPQVHVVRNVAPGKVQLRVTFRVPKAVAFAELASATQARPACDSTGQEVLPEILDGGDDALPAKRARVEMHS